MESDSIESTQWVALLRAINVGSHTVKMDRLRALFEALGFSHVATFIASGNVIFESSSADARTLEHRIERQLRQSLGYDVATFLRSTAELAAIAAHQPFGASELHGNGNSLYIAFLPAVPSGAAQHKLLARQTAIDEFHVHGREVYWLCRKKLSESTFSGALLEKTLGMPSTMRNITTVKKLAAKYPAP